MRPARRAHAVRAQSSRRRVGGAVLVDGLVAILLFSIGILGVLGLQAVAIKQTGNAKYRTDAALYADRLIAQMWSGGKANLATDFSRGGTAFGAWQTQLAGSLPGVDANPPTVSFDGSQVTIVVNWSSPDDGSVHHYTAVSQIVP